MKNAMDNAQLLLGTALMILGVTLTIAAVFSALRDQRTWGDHELWLLPLIGLVLVLVGRRLIQ